jgi:predicted GIY-YIG superfamily endonuclease
LAVSCCNWSARVCWRPPLSAAIVTQLVTHYRGLSCPPEWCQPKLDSRLSNLISTWSRVIIDSMMAEGTVYLLHFERPYHGPMQHYVGFTYDLDRRLEDHRAGTGGITTRRAFEQGIAFSLARTWLGTLKFERQIKARGPSNYCPLCPRRRTRLDLDKGGSGLASPAPPLKPIGANGARGTAPGFSQG